MMDAQQLYLEYQSLAEQSQKVRDYLDEMASSVQEIGKVIEALDAFSKLKKGDRLFAPIANGIFIDANLNDSGTVRMNVGGQTVVPKSVDEAKRLLERQRQELESLHDRANNEYLAMAARMKSIERRLEEKKPDGPAKKVEKPKK